MLVERSAGAVVFRRDIQDSREEILFLLLQKPSGKWDFPKGNMEKGEPTQTTVLREVAEETGIAGLTLLPKFKETFHVFYRREEGLISKWIVFLLAETRQEHVKLSSEHESFSWLPYQQAVGTVSYPQSKKVLRRAHGYLKLKGHAA